MTSSGYRKLFISIGVLSALVFLWARTPLNHYQVDLLELDGLQFVPFDGTELLPAGEQGSVHSHCSWDGSATPYLCGVRVVLPRTEEGLPFSFQQVDQVHIEAYVQSTAAEYSGRLELNITSFLNPHFDGVPSHQDTKFHSVRLRNGEFDIPLNRFDVASWWQDQYGISFESADKDFRHVYSLDLVVNDTPLRHPGQYDLTLSALKVDGFLVDIQQLNNWLLTFWLMVGVGSLLSFSWRGHGTLQRMRQAALFDGMTGLLNEQGLRDHMQGLAPEAGGALYVFRLDNAAILEKHFGENVFGQLLVKTKQRLLSVFQSQSITLARISDAEFAMYCPVGKLAREQLLERIFNEGVEMVGVGHLKLDVSASYVVDNAMPKHFDEVLEKCRFVLDQPHDAKTFARAYLSSYDQPLRQKASVEDALRRALADDAFYLVFMPLYDARRNRVVGAEALLRSSSEVLSRLSPEVYIPVAEKANLIQEIDMMVLKKALAALKQISVPDDFVLSINISAQELLDSDFAQRIAASLQVAGVSATSICLEVTETYFVHMDQAKVEVLEQLRAMGCLVSLDDFGTGYTSFAHLQRLSVDEIKIDRSFVNRLDDPKARVVVESMVHIAQALQYKLVAEGVETLEQIEYLRTLGCNYFQGYLISKPTTLEEAVASTLPESDCLYL
ncbi:Oxygen sensor protein DosP [Marinomonas aquimarina]|uniref:Oxygen sensor protein DosP n=1 Tax=Marinomonas aquimarina TaxID=295068 RepID=A0A1A8T4F9_9GAMM|nr:bifunctional diguanylate cyclase/phosphodiesterase [Marinomonas aquimarina]SBS25739.1 Oxygen sensor protein DosP [Marinomonas aquimarina]